MDSEQVFSCIILKFCSFSGVENPAKGSRECPKAGFTQEQRAASAGNSADAHRSG